MSNTTELVEAGDHMIGRCRSAGHPCPASINPYSLHANLARTGDIGVGFVAYKQYFRGFAASAQCASAW